MLVTQQGRTPRLLQHRRKKLLRHFARDQPLPVLGEHGHVPHLIVHLQPHEPPEQQVVVHLLHQQPLAPPRVQHLQQQRSQQPLRSNRWPSARRIQRVELAGQLAQPCIRHRPNLTQRMIRCNPLLRTHIAEHRSLLLVVSSHPYFLSAFPVHPRSKRDAPNDFFRKLFSRALPDPDGLCEPD